MTVTQGARVSIESALPEIVIPAEAGIQDAQAIVDSPVAIRDRFPLSGE